jgi:hypothetical protein
MPKVALQLGAELDLLSKDELDQSLAAQADAWAHQAAYGVRQQDLPRMYGTPSSGSLALGYDQPGGTYCGPRSGWSWAVHRISVAGLASGDQVQVYNQAKFVGWVAYQPGFITFGKGGLTLKDGDYLRVIGTGLSATGQVEVFGEAVSAPSEMIWKILS